MDECPILPFEAVEEWRAVIGWEGFYEVSDLGRVRSLPRLTSTGATPGGRILKPAISGGRLMVNLCREGIAKGHRIHRLVAAAFIGPCPEGLEVCHGPGGALDNRAANLTYGTKKKNCGPDKVRDGTTNRGERSAVAKLTEEIVAECRTRALAGETHYDLAREFGVGQQTMWSAVVGKTWFVVNVPPVPIGDGRGENQGMAKLTWDQVAEIRRRASAGEIHRTIAADYGVGRRAIGKIVTGQHWRGDPSFKVQKYDASGKRAYT
jgi:hypothetical protein